MNQTKLTVTAGHHEQRILHTPVESMSACVHAVIKANTDSEMCLFFYTWGEMRNTGIFTIGLRLLDPTVFLKRFCHVYINIKVE